MAYVFCPGSYKEPNGGIGAEGGGLVGICPHCNTKQCLTTMGNMFQHNYDPNIVRGSAEKEQGSKH